MPPLRIAHRGYARLGGENTLEAFRNAARLGAEAFEIDVRRRRDGVLVVHHDRSDAPQAPLLLDVLKLAAESGVEVNLDLKASDLQEPLIAAVREAGMLGRTTCTGGNWPLLLDIHQRERGIRAGITVPKRLAPGFLQPLQRWWYAFRLPVLLKVYEAGVISAHHRLVNRAVVRRTHGAGAQVWAWTVDDPREIARLERAGVDGIASDAPQSQSGLRAE